MTEQMMRFNRKLVVFATLLQLAAGGLNGQETATPTPADTLFQSAAAQLSQGKFQDAEESFRKLAEIEPTTSRGILGLADVWVAQKKPDDALRLLQGESVKYPTRPDLHFGIGNVALRTARYDLAIAEFQLVLDRVDRNSKGAAELYLRMGDAYRLKGDLDFAVTLLRQAQTLQPANLVILNALAFTLESVRPKAASRGPISQNAGTRPEKRHCAQQSRLHPRRHR